MNAETERYHVRRAEKIIRQFIQNERAMRERTFRHAPHTRAQKLAECDQALRAFAWLMERLYRARPDLRPEPEPRAEQPLLLENELSGGSR